LAELASTRLPSSLSGCRAGCLLLLHFQVKDPQRIAPELTWRMKGCTRKISFSPEVNSHEFLSL
jgi:hypothetical protein